MKILIPLLFLTLSANANEVVYGSKSGTTEFEVEGVPDPVVIPDSQKIVDVAAGEAIQILNVTAVGEGDTNRNIEVKHGNLPRMVWQKWNQDENGPFMRPIDTNKIIARTDNIMVGPCSIFIGDGTNPEIFDWQVSYKLTKPSAAGTTTSAPILLPPTQDAAKSWFVKLQVSSDLKAWDDVAPGQFLGSDTARFFRVQTSEAE